MSCSVEHEKSFITSGPGMATPTFNIQLQRVFFKAMGKFSRALLKADCIFQD